MISDARRKVVLNDIVMLVLLQHLHVVKNVVSGPEILNKPGAQIGPIPENLALNVVLMLPRHRDEIFLGDFCMRRQRIIEPKTGHYGEQAHSDQRRKHARNTDAGGQH